MEQIYVKLRDKGSICYDMSQDVAITGDEPVLVKKTPKISKALKNGVLNKVDAPKQQKQDIRPLKPPYQKAKKDQLKAELDRREIPYGDQLTNNELAELLDIDDLRKQLTELELEFTEDNTLEELQEILDNHNKDDE